MMIRIRLKNHPDKYVGKSDPTYAVRCDAFLKERGDRPLPALLEAHWFVPEARAKVWSSIKDLRRFLSLCAQQSYKLATFSEYEAVYPDGATQPLDEAVKDLPTGDPYLDGILARGVPVNSLMTRATPEATVPVHWISRVSGPHDFESLKAALTQHGFPFEVYDGKEDEEPGHTIVLTPIPGFSILIHADEDGNLMAPSLLDE